MGHFKLKHTAKQHMLKPRRPLCFTVTLVYLIFTTLLLQLIYNLSEIGQVQTQLFVALSQQADAFARYGIMPPLALPSFSPTLFGSFFFVVPWLFIWILDLGFLFYNRALIKDENPGIRGLFEGFNYFVKGVLVRLVHSVLLIGGLILLIVPGLIVLCAFSQVNFLLLDHPEKGVIWFFAESARLMRRRKWDYFVLQLSFLGWRVLNVVLVTTLPFLRYAIHIWFYPYSTLTFVAYYNELSGQTPPPPEGEWKRPGMY